MKPNATTSNPETYLKEMLEKHYFICFVIIRTRTNGLWDNRLVAVRCTTSANSFQMPKNRLELAGLLKILK